MVVDLPKDKVDEVTTELYISNADGSRHAVSSEELVLRVEEFIRSH